MAQQGHEKQKESNTSGSEGHVGGISGAKPETSLRAETGGGWQQSSGSGTGSKMGAIPGGKSRGEEDESEARSRGKHATDFFRRGKEKATALAGRAQHYGADATREVSAVLKKYPLQSIAVGFGLGILAGSLINRR